MPAHNLPRPDPIAATEPPFSLPATVHGVWQFARHDLENYKLMLLGREPLPPPSVTEFVGAANVCREFNFSRRTLARRVREALERKAAIEARALAESDA
jgi:hypothetical protein